MPSGYSAEAAALCIEATALQARVRPRLIYGAFLLAVTLAATIVTGSFVFFVLTVAVARSFLHACRLTAELASYIPQLEAMV